MEQAKTKNIISALLIIIMVASIFALPVLSDDGKAYAATKKVKITYKANKGKFTASKYAKKASYSKKIKKGQKLGKLPKVTRPGYSLKGWYTKKTGGKKVTKKTKITKKTTLHARWTAKKYTLSFNANGGTAVSPANKKISFGSTYGALPVATRAGCKFLGWYTAKTGGQKVKSTNKYTKTKNVTLYARWDEKYLINPKSSNLLGKTFEQVEVEIPSLFIIKTETIDGKSYISATQLGFAYLFIFQNNKCIIVEATNEILFPQVGNKDILLSDFNGYYGIGINKYSDASGRIGNEYNLGKFNLLFTYTNNEGLSHTPENFPHAIYTISFDEFMKVQTALSDS